MKLIFANRNYSSWSLRGWLACKQSGVPFEVLTVPLGEFTQCGGGVHCLTMPLRRQPSPI